MFYTNTNSLYNKFNYSKCKKTNEILFNTKAVILNCDHYNGYITDYSTQTQRSSFKEPARTNYPILHNKNFISLQKQNELLQSSHNTCRLDTDITSENEFQCATISSSSKQRKVITMPSSSQSNHKPKKKFLFLRTESDINIDTNSNNNNDYTTNNNNNAVFFTDSNTNNMLFSKTSSSQFNMNKHLHKRLTTKNDNDEYMQLQLHKKNEIFILVDTLFNNHIYKYLPFEEEKIFHKEQHYITYMKSKLLQLKDTLVKDVSKFKTVYIHTYPNTIKGNIELQLYSARIEISSPLKKDNNTIIYELPFDFLPLLYLNNFEHIKQMLLTAISNSTSTTSSSSLPITNDHFEKIILNQIDSKGEFVYFKTKNCFYKTDQDVLMEFDFNHHNQLNSDNSNNNTYMEILFEIDKNAKKKHIKNLNINIEAGDNYNSGDNTILFLQSMKRFCCKWCVNTSHQDNINYQIQITLPELYLKFPHLKKQINHFVDKELMMYLLQNNFSNWDFYCIYYLFSLKKFRMFIYNILSKQITTLSKLPIHKRLANGYECLSLSNKHHLNRKYNFNDKQLSFIITDHFNNSNHLFVLHSYMFFIYYPELRKDKIFTFYFTFHQMKILYLISKKESLELFIQKIMLIDKHKRTIDIDFSFFELFIGKTLNEIDESIKHIHQKQINEDTLLHVINAGKKNNNGVQIKIIFPFCELVGFCEDVDGWKRKKIRIDEVLIKALIKEDNINNWVDVISKLEFIKNKENYSYIEKEEDEEWKNGNCYQGKKTYKNGMNKKRMFGEQNGMMYNKYTTPKASGKFNFNKYGNNTVKMQGITPVARNSKIFFVFKEGMA